MNAKLIKTEADHAAALARIDEIFQARPGTVEGDELELLVHLVEEYEGANHPIDWPDAIEAIKFRMDQAGLKQADLVAYIGSKSKVSEVLSGKRALSLAMIRRLHKDLGIPAHVLLQEPGTALSTVYEGVNWRDFPLAEMLRRHWFPTFKGRASDLCERAEEVLGPLLFPGGRDYREVALAARQRRDVEMDVAELAVAARLLLVAAMLSDACANGFAVRNRRGRGGDIHIETPLQTFQRQAQMPFAQSRHQHLPAFRIVSDMQAGILFHQLGECARQTDVILTVGRGDRERKQGWAGAPRVLPL